MMFTLSELFSYAPPVPKGLWWWAIALFVCALLTVYFYKTAKGGKKK